MLIVFIYYEINLNTMLLNIKIPIFKHVDQFARAGLAWWMRGISNRAPVSMTDDITI